MRARSCIHIRSPLPLIQVVQGLAAGVINSALQYPISKCQAHSTESLVCYRVLSGTFVVRGAGSGYVLVQLSIVSSSSRRPSTTQNPLNARSTDGHRDRTDGTDGTDDYLAAGRWAAFHSSTTAHDDSSVAHGGPNIYSNFLDLLQYSTAQSSSEYGARLSTRLPIDEWNLHDNLGNPFSTSSAHLPVAFAVSFGIVNPAPHTRLHSPCAACASRAPSTR